MKTHLLIYLLLLSAWSAHAEQKQLHARLEEDLDAGMISRAEFLAWQLVAAQDPQLLPPAYRDATPDWPICPTLLAAEARAMLPTLSNGEQALLSPLLSRPGSERLPLSIVSPKGHFKIHYVTKGYDSTSVEFAEEAALSLDYVYDILVRQMGFSPPPEDNGIDGPELDIYIIKFYAYGETRFENPVEGSGGQAYTSFIVIDSQFSGSGFATRGIDALHVTVAHEFFHMLQGGYRFFPSTTMDSRFLFEASSTWFEDLAYDDVNDYLQYVRSFMSSPNQPLHSYSNITYGLGLYMAMLYKQHGYGVIRKIWEELRDQEPLPALDNALRTAGNDLGRSLASFSVWNAFTAEYSDTLHYYHDAALYPAITPLAQYSLQEQLTVSGAASELQTHYYAITVPGGGSFSVLPSFPNPAEWIYTLVIHEPGFGSRIHTIAGNAPLSFGPLTLNSDIRLAVVNIRWPVSGSGSNQTEYAFQFFPQTSMAERENGIVRTLPSPFRPLQDERLQIQFYLRETAESASIYILSERGEVLHTQRMLALPQGLNCYFWDGCNNAGTPLPSGIYLCAIQGIGPFRPHKFALLR